MAYGIDDTIQQKVDAYRSNPGALQRRYAQNKELVDLLALQKLKSEKDAAARDMQMKMQQSPKTIAQQYEEELVGRTKNEMLQGVAGVMQQRQAQQQRNMQRVANMPRMAQGGIVGFATGGSPQDIFEEIKKIRERVAKGEITPKEGEAQIEAIAPEQKDPSGRRGIFSGFLGSDKRSKVRPTTGGPTKATAENPLDQVILDATTQGMTGTTEGSILGDGGTSSQRAPEQPQKIDSTLAQNMIPPATPAEEPPAEAPVSDPVQDALDRAKGVLGSAPTGTLPEDVLAGLTTTVPTVKAPKVDRTRFDDLTSALAGQAKADIAIDPKAERTAARTDAMGFLDLSSEAKQLQEDLLDERRAQEKIITDTIAKRYGSEDRLRRDRLIDSLLGARGTTAAAALASSGLAGRETGRRQARGLDALQADLRGVQDKRFTQQQGIIDAEAARKDKALTAGTEAFSQAKQDIRTGKLLISQLSQAEMEFATQQADALLQADLGNQRTAIAERGNELRAVLQISDQAFQGQLAKYKGEVQLSLKTIDAYMAGEKNRVIEAYYKAIVEDKKNNTTINAARVGKEIQNVIATITKNYNEAFAELITEARDMADDPDYTGPKLEDIIKTRDAAIDASTAGLTDIFKSLESQINDGFGDLQ